ncbi:unnamed protein product, partial [Staurois parvus]
TSRERRTRWTINPPGGIPECSSGKVSEPTAVTPPGLHSGIHCSVAPGSLLHLPCPALPRCPPCSVPAMSSDAGICLPGSVPCDVGTYGGRNWRREIQKCEKV